MNLDLHAMVEAMVQAAAGALASYGKEAHSTAANELTAIAELIRQIGIARENQTITPQDATDLLDQAKLAARTAMDTQAGIAAITAQTAIDLALRAVASVVNGYLGFQLI